MSSRRPFSRPRTKVYDCNYNMGECYYRATLDSLDRKGQGRTIGAAPVQETIEPPSAPTRVSRPRSTLELDSVEGRVQKEVQSEMEEEMASTLRRIRAARAAAVATPEESFESAFHNRSEQVKKRSALKDKFSEKMLDSVGINGVMSDDGPITVRKRSSRLLEETAPSVVWTAMDDSAGRALRSRARLADLESEMEELVERGAARERRAAGLRQMLAQEAQSVASMSASQRTVNKKMTVTTEKRSVAY